MTMILYISRLLGTFTEFWNILSERRSNVPVHYTKSVNSFYEDSSIFDHSFSYGISPSGKERSFKGNATNF